MADIQQPLVLYRGFPVENKYAWSAFVTKTEFRVRHAKVAYTIQEGSTREGPNGKVPYMDVGSLTQANERQLVADSTFIIKALVDRGVVPDLNAELTPEQRTADLAIRAMLEEKAYFLGMVERWLDNYYIHRDYILQTKPWLLRVFIGNLIHKKIVQTVHLQGCGRFTKEEQRQIREEIWQTLEDMCAERRKTSKRGAGPFWILGGQQPTEADAVLYAFVNSNLVCTSCPESTRLTKSLPNLMEYAGCIHDTYFPDYEKWEM